jgi:hypothetical protein
MNIKLKTIIEGEGGGGGGCDNNPTSLIRWNELLSHKAQDWCWAIFKESGTNILHI